MRRCGDQSWLARVARAEDALIQTSLVPARTCLALIKLPCTSHRADNRGLASAVWHLTIRNRPDKPRVNSTGFAAQTGETQARNDDAVREVLMVNSEPVGLSSSGSRAAVVALTASRRQPGCLT